MIINGKHLIAGRLASFAAKQALLGEEVIIYNSEHVMMTGGKANVTKHQEERQARGHPYKGPFVPKTEDRLLKRMIRGMVPHKQERGRTALAKVRCYRGVPDTITEDKTTEVKGAHITKTQTLKYITLGELCRRTGRKGQ